MIQGIKFFTEGTHNTKSAKKTWSKDDVKAVFARTKTALRDGGEIPFIVNHFDKKPVVVGGVKADALIYGDEDGKSYLAFDKSKAWFANSAPDLLKKSGYNKLSAGILMPSRQLDHIAFVQEAAVAEMNETAVFSVGELSDGETVEYADCAADDLVAAFEADGYRFKATASVFQKLREWIVANFTAEAADKAIPQYEIDYLKAAREQELMDEAEKKKQFFSTQSETEMTEQEKAAMQKRIDELEASLVSEQKAKKEAAERIAAFEREKRAADLERVLSDKAFAGIVTPKNKSMHLKALSALAAQSEEVAVFSTEVSYSLAKSVAEYLEELKAQPKVYETKEIAGFGAGRTGEKPDANAMGVEAAALCAEYRAKGKNISITDAYAEIERKYANI